MADYTKTTNFTAKDALSTGDPNKVIKGETHDTEFDNIETAVATKSNKVVSGTTDNVIKQSASGDLTDAGYSFSGLTGDTAVTKAEFDVLDGCTSTTAELNILDGVTSTAAELNILDGVTANATELNIMDGISPTTTELNYVNGVTSAIQTQIDGKGTLPIAYANLSFSNNIDSDDLAADSVGTSELKTAVGSTSSGSLNNSTWTPSVGYYNVVIVSGTGTTFFEMNVSASWRRSIQEFAGGMVWCDGTNMRFIETSSNANGYYYQKLS